MHDEFIDYDFNLPEDIYVAVDGGDPHIEVIRASNGSDNIGPVSYEVDIFAETSELITELIPALFPKGTPDGYYVVKGIRMDVDDIDGFMSFSWEEARIVGGLELIKTWHVTLAVLRRWISCNVKAFRGQFPPSWYYNKTAK